MNRKQTSTKSIMKFILFSGICSVILILVLKKIGILSDVLIVGNKPVTGIRMKLIYLALYLCSLLWFIAIVGIRKHSWKKVFSTACFPASVFLLFRIQLVYGELFSIGAFVVVGLVIPVIFGTVFSALEWDGFGEEESTFKKKCFSDLLNEYLPGGAYTFLFWVSMIILNNINTLYTMSCIENGYVSLQEQFAEAGDLYNIESLSDKEAAAFMLYAGPLTFSDSSKYYDAEVGHLWETNKIGLHDLQKNVYDESSAREKLNALQTLVEIESKALLDTHGVIRIALGITEENVGGYFSSDYQTIVISEESLNDRDTAIYVVLHEMKHAHQFYVTEYLETIGAYDSKLLKNTDMYDWKYEQVHYTSGSSGNLDEYISQSIELDAYFYANDWCDDYIDYIEGIGVEGSGV